MECGDLAATDDCGGIDKIDALGAGCDGAEGVGEANGGELGSIPRNGVSADFGGVGR